MNGDVPFSITTTRAAPTDTTTSHPRQPTRQEIDDPTMGPTQPSQHNADDPTTSLCEGDQSMECQSEGGHSGSISQTQHPRLANKNEGDEEVTTNNTTTRTATTNTTTARPAPTNTTTTQPIQTQEEEEKNSEQYMEMCRSALQDACSQQRHTTHNPTRNTTTQSTHRDSAATTGSKSSSTNSAISKTDTGTSSPSTKLGENKKKNHGRRDKDTLSHQQAAILIHKRWTKHIKEVQHTGSRLTGVSIVKKKFRLQVSSVYFSHTGCGDEHVQQVYSELQKHPDRCRKTNTHIDRRRLQRARSSKRRNRSDRLQIHRKTRTRRAKPHIPVDQTLGSPTPTDAGQHVLPKTRIQHSHVPHDQTMQAT